MKPVLRRSSSGWSERDARGERTFEMLYDVAVVSDEHAFVETRVGYVFVVFLRPEVGPRDGVVSNAWLEPRVRRSGVGELIYRELASRVASMGGVLYSSTDRSEAAEGLWKKLVSKGLAEPVGERYRFKEKPCTR